MSSVSVQDYLLTIYRLQASDSPVSTTALAVQLDVAPPSVTGMMRKLHRDGLVAYRPYHGAELTGAGEREALRLLRRHRLWELFLTDVLGLAWDEVHAEAHRLEHATSQRVADRLAAFLGEPEADPHGQPIPARDGALSPRAVQRLSEVAVGQRVRVAEVPDDDADLLRHLAGLGLYPQVELQVVASDLPDGPLTLLVEGSEQKLARQVAAQILVEEL